MQSSIIKYRAPERALSGRCVREARFLVRETNPRLPGGTIGSLLVASDTLSWRKTPRCLLDSIAPQLAPARARDGDEACAMTMRRVWWLSTVGLADCALGLHSARVRFPNATQALLSAQLWNAAREGRTDHVGQLIAAGASTRARDGVSSQPRSPTQALERAGAMARNMSTCAAAA
jgi:hypothetical protein